MTPFEHVHQVLNNQARIAKGAGNGYEQHIWEELSDYAAAYEKWLANWRESSRPMSPICPMSL